MQLEEPLSRARRPGTRLEQRQAVNVKPIVKFIAAPGVRASRSVDPAFRADYEVRRVTTMIIESPRRVNKASIAHRMSVFRLVRRDSAHQRRLGRQCSGVPRPCRSSRHDFEKVAVRVEERETRPYPPRKPLVKFGHCFRQKPRAAPWSDRSTPRSGWPSPRHCAGRKRHG